jgi:hypothetical protein
VPQPVTLGVPFPRGLLADPAQLALVNPEGRELPLQTRPLARWPDGSVKWLLLDFVTPGGYGWSLQTVPGRTAGPSSSRLAVSEEAGGPVVKTGVAEFCIEKRILRPFSRVWCGDRLAFDQADKQCGLALTIRRGQSGWIPGLRRAVVESAGPVRATVSLEGRFPEPMPCHVGVRLCFFEGSGLVRLRITLHNPRPARHPGGRWDLGDPGSVFFEALTLMLWLSGPGEPRVAWRAESGGAVHTLPSTALEIYQDSSGGAAWDSRNHVTREGRKATSFRGYRVRTPGGETHGLRASPVVSIADAHGSLAVAIPEFWQQFPKALEVQGRRIWLHLFPPHAADLHELQGGEQKTHTVWLHFGPGGEPSTAPLDWVHAPLRVCVPPEWVAAAGVIPFLAPAEEVSHPPLEELLAEAVHPERGLAARREVIDEYGWRNYGDVWADHEGGAGYAGPQPVVSHYNNQYDVIFGTLLQYLRTADPRWRDLFDPLARHVIDIDVYHTTGDRAAYSGGLFWHTAHYEDAATGTHRSYSRANARPGVPYGGGPSNEHNYTTGLLHYFYLTGDELARDTVLGLAEWVIRMDDGRRTPFGKIDPGPTGLASFTREPDYHGPGRGAGNSVNALLDAWLLTGERPYLDKAEELIRRCVNPADDAPARDLLNLELRWSYTVFLVVLSRYLDLKAEVGQVDAASAYARASLLRYGEWMVEHEKPYFDQVEKMEYPTETWAAQEVRKANVLRLAARHADEPLRSRLLARGTELADRAWADLYRFPSRTTARPLALVLVEGTRDAFFRHRTLQPAPRPGREYAFPAPENFVSQKRRVLARLRSPGGLARTLLGLADVRKWWQR